MSLLKANSVQIGQSATATNNFTLSVPSSPDGTIKLARGNSGATTADVLTVNASGAITGATISGATINSSTINGGSITLGTAQNSTSGTAIDFTGIPSWAKRITVMFRGVSTNGTSPFLIQLGDSGGIETTGYAATSSGMVNASNYTPQSSTAGYVIGFFNAADIASGHMVITKIDGNSWVSSHTIKNATNIIIYGGGDKSLSDTLTQVRITTVNGTDTFDAGSINIMYEG